jgi:flavin-dependent dehydrogenase
VDDLVQDADGVEAAGVRARYIVGADGLHSHVRRALGLAMRHGSRPRFGVRQHFATAPWTDMVEVHWLPDAEVYVTPVAHDVVGVAVLGEAPLHFDATLARLPRLSERVVSSPVASELRGAGPLRQRVSARHVGRALLVGDAAGYVDALTGEGLRVGFAEAEAVVRAVVAGDPQAYEAEWLRITRSYRWLTTALVWTASKPRLRSLIVPSSRALPPVFTRIVNGLAY